MYSHEQQDERTTLLNSNHSDQIVMDIAEQRDEENSILSTTSLKRRKKRKQDAYHQVIRMRRYGLSPFEHIMVRSPYHLSVIVATVEAFFASTSFAAPTITALLAAINKSLIEHEIQPIGHSDLFSVAGLLCATPGFLLLRNGTRLTNEEILRRIRHGFRLFDLLTFGISHRWGDNTYNHDSKLMYLVEAITLPILHALLAVSPASGLSQAWVVVNDPNYILKMFIQNKQALLWTASFGTYIPIVLINGTYLMVSVRNCLNWLARKLGDTHEIAVKRAELLEFLAEFKQIDQSKLDKEHFLAQLSEYKQLTETHSDVVPIKKLLFKLAQMKRELDLTFIPETRLMRGWGYFSSTTGIILAIIAALPTYPLSYNLVNLPWFRNLSKWAQDWKKCLLGTTIGFIATLMPIPINYTSCKELLMFLSNIKQLPNLIKNCSYNEARNIILAVGLSAFSGVVAFYLAYQNPMEIDSECKSALPANFVSVLSKFYSVLNASVPIANGINSFALAFKSLIDFLNEQTLKVEMEALRNARDMSALYNAETGEPHFQRHLLEAAHKMFLEEIERLEDYLKRSSGHKKIAKLPSRAELEDVEQQNSTLANRGGQGGLTLGRQTRYNYTELLNAHGSLSRRHSRINSPNDDNTLQIEAQEVELPRLQRHRSRPSQWSCCTIS